MLQLSLRVKSNFRESCRFYLLDAREFIFLNLMPVFDLLVQLVAVMVKVGELKEVARVKHDGMLSTFLHPVVSILQLHRLSLVK